MDQTWASLFNNNNNNNSNNTTRVLNREYITKRKWLYTCTQLNPHRTHIFHCLPPSKLLCTDFNGFFWTIFCLDLPPPLTWAVPGSGGSGRRRSSEPGSTPRSAGGSAHLRCPPSSPPPPPPPPTPHQRSPVALWGGTGCPRGSRTCPSPPPPYSQRGDDVLRGVSRLVGLERWHALMTVVVIGWWLKSTKIGN